MNGRMGKWEFVCRVLGLTFAEGDVQRGVCLVDSLRAVHDEGAEGVRLVIFRVGEGDCVETVLASSVDCGLREVDMLAAVWRHLMDRKAHSIAGIQRDTWGNNGGWMDSAQEVRRSEAR